MELVRGMARGMVVLADVPFVRRDLSVCVEMVRVCASCWIVIRACYGENET